MGKRRALHLFSFDRVPHQLLISKMKAYRFDEKVLIWIEMLLQGRTSVVLVQNRGYFMLHFMCLMAPCWALAFSSLQKWHASLREIFFLLSVWWYTELASLSNFERYRISCFIFNAVSLNGNILCRLCTIFSRGCVFIYLVTIWLSKFSVYLPHFQPISHPSTAQQGLQVFMGLFYGTRAKETHKVQACPLAIITIIWQR